MTEQAPLTTDQHTIGPWIAEVSDILGIIVYAEKCHSMIAPCNTLGAEGAAFVDSVEQQAANARLIAAAPELLESLREFLACFGSTSMMSQKARMAIAKAEGKL